MDNSNHTGTAKCLPPIHIVPAIEITNAIKDNGFPLSTHIQEMIDNSIDSGREPMTDIEETGNLTIDIVVRYNKQTGEIEVTQWDNANGFRDLSSALTPACPGNKRVKGSIGMFNMGLYRSLNSMGSQHELITKTLKGPCYRVVIDQDKIAKTAADSAERDVIKQWQYSTTTIHEELSPHHPKHLPNPGSVIAVLNVNKKLFNIPPEADEKVIEEKLRKGIKDLRMELARVNDINLQKGIEFFDYATRQLALEKDGKTYRRRALVVTINGERLYGANLALEGEQDPASDNQPLKLCHSANGQIIMTKFSNPAKTRVIVIDPSVDGRTNKDRYINLEGSGAFIYRNGRLIAHSPTLFQSGRKRVHGSFNHLRMFLYLDDTFDSCFDFNSKKSDTFVKEWARKMFEDAFFTSATIKLMEDTYDTAEKALAKLNGDKEEKKEQKMVEALKQTVSDQKIEIKVTKQENHVLRDSVKTIREEADDLSSMLIRAQARIRELEDEVRRLREQLSRTKALSV